MVCININIKKIGKKENKIDQILYEYPDGIKTAEDFLKETVKISRKEYKNRRDAKEVMGVLSKEALEKKTKAGKVTYGMFRKEKLPKEEESIENALQCFEDGLIVLFVNEKKIEHLADAVELTDGDEVSFIKMTMLAGRMW